MPSAKVRFSLRWKLILTIAIPLLVIYSLLLSAQHRRLKAAAETEARQSVSERAELYASRFDAFLSTVAQAALSTASAVSLLGETDEASLFSLLEATARQHPLIYGSCLAFEPEFAPGGPRRYAPYVYWKGGTLTRMDVASAYDYTQPRWAWYSGPRDTGMPGWTEPYYDQGAGNIVMCTFSAPFTRQGAFAGVVTVDLPVEPLQEALGPLEAQEWSFAIVGRTGTFISAPGPVTLVNETIFDAARRSNDPQATQVAHAIVSGERGIARVRRTFISDRPHWLAYAPISSSGWSFVAVIPEAAAMRPALESLAGLGLVMLLGLSAILGVVYLASTRITRPLARLTDGVERLAGGDLNAPPVRAPAGDELGLLASSFNTMVARLRTNLELLARETSAREAVEAELRIARGIQASFLPRTWPAFPGRGEFDLHALNLPAKHVAGDFYDFFFTNEHTLAVVIGDVSGKGVPAALFMAVTRTLVRDHARDHDDPGRILAEVNATLLKQNDHGMFVTMFLGLYDVATGALRYANAGHPPPLRLSGAKPAARYGETTGAILAAIEDATFATAQASLDPGDTLLFYTDGVTEARAPDGAFYEESRLRDLADDRRQDTAEALCRAVIDAADEYQNHVLHDDVTVLVLRRLR